MAEPAQNKGFTLPAPKTDKELPTATQPAPLNVTQTKDMSSSVGVSELPQPRDYVIAGGILLVLLIAFFFAKNAYANHLSGKRIPPGAANAAGWWIFIFLSCLASAAVLSVLSPVKFLTPLVMAPLLVISVLALILMFYSSRRT